jgi:formylglycine-generating enzyme required for sulfatase activity
MHGNVYEWCQDWSDDDGTLEATTDPWGPTSGSERMIRGGYFRAEPSDLRSANRNDLPPSTSETYYGFRLALSE